MILARSREVEGTVAWETPEYDAGDINAAGRSLLLGSQVTAEERQRAIEVITHWRAVHGFPLNSLQMNLRGRTRRVQRHQAASVAQRLKRLPAIEAKLKRFGTMRLAQMQDIGGCRSVVNGAQQLADLVDAFKTSTRSKHEFVREKDYLDHPKEDGYRSHHLIYRFHSDSPQSCVWNGVDIEVQVRTQLQHAWATAVETVDLFTGQALKSSLGQDRWKRFFLLMGDYVARKEKLPLLLDGTAIRKEVRALVHELSVIESLEAWSVARRTLRQADTKAAYYLLTLDTESRQITFFVFGEREIAAAVAMYENTEKSLAGSSVKHTVLVRADSASAVRTAYRGFFADSRRFVGLIREAVA